MPTDGLPNQTYNAWSNQITTAGYEYDLAGNLTKGQAADGTWQRYSYDAAGRLFQVIRDSDNFLQQMNYYTSSRQRRASISHATANLTFYVWGGSSVITEYEVPWGTANVSWVKSYIYAGSRLLSTFTKNGASETLEFHHPDRLGTRLVTNNTANTSFEQNTLPFGTALGAETTGTTNQRFTSYERSTVASLDYAVNRSYSSGQGRFTSVDPIGMSATSLRSPQTLNLYAYVGNMPTDKRDPTGLLCYWINLGERGYIYDCSPGVDGGGPPDRPGPEPKCPGRSCGGGEQPPSQKNPCDARLTGDSDVNTVAQILFGESVSGNAATYSWMGDVMLNRLHLGLKEFGCSISDVALRLSDADDRNNFGFKAAGSDENLKNLNPEQCASFKIAQRMAKNIVNESRLDQDPGTRGLSIPRFRKELKLKSEKYFKSAPAFWWRAGSKSGDGAFAVGDTTFYSYDPESPKTTWVDQIAKSNEGRAKNIGSWVCD